MPEKCIYRVCDLRTNILGHYWQQVSVAQLDSLSAYLYGITRNETFRNTAELSQQFTQSQFYDRQTGIMIDTLNLTSCDIDGSHTSTQDTALYLEGISLLANLTNNSALGSLYVFLVFGHTVVVMLRLIRSAARISWLPTLWWPQIGQRKGLG